MKKLTQKQQILESLQEGFHLSKLQILQRFKIWNSGHIIYKLRKEGYAIKTTMIRNELSGKYFATYHF